MKHLILRASRESHHLFEVREHGSEYLLGHLFYTLVPGELGPEPLFCFRSDDGLVTPPFPSVRDALALHFGQHLGHTVMLGEVI
jgi:hypothetical protein